MVIHLLLMADGVVQRFGRLVPGTVALCAAVERLNARLEQGPTADKVEVHVVRRQSGVGDSDPSDAEALRFEIQSMGGLPIRPRAHVISSFRGLRSQLRLDPEAVCVVFTATQRDFEAAWAAELDAYRIGFETAGVPSRAVPFDDAQRILEEKLRIPTARPMSRVARTGGLLAVHCDSVVDAQHQAMESMKRDVHADWTILGTTLILYTEEPDYEDRLAERPDVERLSYGVQKDHLSLISTEEGVAEAGDEKRLFRQKGFLLTENPSETLRSLTWSTVRRRHWAQRSERPLPSMAELLQRIEKPIEISAVVADPVEALAEQVGSKGCLDIFQEGEKTQAIAWQAAGEGPGEPDSLVVVVHHVDDFDDAEKLSEFLSLWESGMCRDLGDTLHCVALPEVSTEALIQAFLMPEEGHRARVVEG